MTTLAVNVTDAARSIGKNGNTSTFTLDPDDRRATETVTNSTGTITASAERHYVDGSDNPGWAKTTKGNTITTSWYGGSIGGDLGMIANAVNTNGTTKNTTSISIVDTLGSVITSYLIPAAGNPISLESVGTYDEYGNKAATGPDTGALNYGWLGGKERATNDITNLVLMGARLYNSITGTFTSRDPVKGGNTTDYTYPQDPINHQDLDGQVMQSTWQKWSKGLGTAGKVLAVAGFAACVFATAGACTALGLIGATVRTASRFTGKWGGNGQSYKRVIGESVIDFAFTKVPAVRKGIVGKHSKAGVSAIKGGVNLARPKASQALMYTPKRTLIRGLLSAISSVK